MRQGVVTAASFFIEVTCQDSRRKIGCNIRMLKLFIKIGDVKYELDNKARTSRGLQIN